MPIYAINKRVGFDYEITEKYEAGIVLTGQEVKSIKTGHINLKGGFVTLKQDPNKRLPELYLINCHIPPYKQAGKLPDYNPTRSRKLLLKKSEIKRLLGKVKEQGLTLVPIKVYNKGSLIKVQFGVGKGRKKTDKREIIKKREIERKIRKLKQQLKQ